MAFLLLAFVASIAATTASAQALNALPAELVYRDWLKPPFNAGTVERGGQVRELPETAPAKKAELASTIDAARGLVERNAVLGLLLLEKDGSILFETYRKGATASDPMIGYSMSKSATSIAVGQALCDGLIASLDDPAQRYADVLTGTAYGTATLRQLLTMSSAGKKPIPGAGQPVPGSTTSLLRTQTKTIRAGFREYGSGGSDASTLGEFEYKGFDTYALGVVLAQASKRPVHAYFSQAVWRKVGAESNAFWLADRDGDASTAEGFGARLRDWARLALYVRDLAGEGGQQTCLGRYLKEATTTRIRINSNVNRNHSGYGYQFWTEHWQAKDAFWMTGFGGQRIAIDRASGRVLVLISHVEDFMPEVDRFFARWIGR